ncbi:MAG: Na+/H+ antiporter NhaC family protein [Candidatus Faecousia sp.]|nr:Na+/H+ antiporter NhaC family protein [Candidatus Faecousia sp.]
MKTISRLLTLLLTLAVVFGLMTLTAGAAALSEEDAAAYLDDYASNVGSDPDFDANIADSIRVVRGSIGSYATILSLLPPIIAIVLALLTKEVYSSLFVGILSGALIYSNGNVWNMVLTTFDTMISKICDSWNVGILIFLVMLGMMVSLVNKAGGSAAYGRWASKHIKTKAGALVSTSVLGMLIFIDDYFNCLTVGSVMRPVTDKFKISREKLAYIIDSTAAPVCIIAPISSWAAAVSSIAPEGEGLNLFIRSIPYNLYALLTLLCVVVMSVMGLDFGKMRMVELAAASKESEENAASDEIKGTVLDLMLPIGVLIVSCVTAMIYTGGFFDAESGCYHNFVEAFAGCDASQGLVLGAFVTIVMTMLLYLPRRVLTFTQFTDSFVDGFKAMVPAILILTFAWTLSGITNQLGAKIYVAELVRGTASGLANLLPAIIFLIGVGLAFSTGTSWGTFGVLLPIVCAVFPSGELMVISVSACLAGAVCGDHCSPISDTTIMASAGADCNHIGHVSTQLPYALTVAGVSFLGYLLAGFVQKVWIVLPVAVVMMLATLLVIRTVQKKHLG